MMSTPQNPLSPGVYILELPSATRTITGVSTSITAFIGAALRGPVNEAITINSFAEFERTFGGLWRFSKMSYAVYHYFLNGGRDAIIIRVQNGAASSTIIAGNLTLQAANPGAWGDNLRVEIGLTDRADIQDLVDAEEALDPAGTNTLFNLTVSEQVSPNEPLAVRETFRNLSTKPASPKFVTRIFAEQSDYVRATAVPTPAAQPAAGTYSAQAGSGNDGGALTAGNIVGGAGPPRTGLAVLETVDLFNILCIPSYDRALDTTPADMYTTVYRDALPYCETKRAIIIVDPPLEWNAVADPQGGIDGPNLRPLRHRNAAFFFPNIIVADPEADNNARPFVPCGAVAGVMARIDSERGVWKSPAGIEAGLAGVMDLTVHLTDDENGRLNPLGVNCLRILPPAGAVVWGSRTMRGADRLADQWKYLAVRRTALYIEESLYRGTQWVVFDSNHEGTWAQIRLNVGAFMHNLFRQGAFQGPTSKDAYFVKCDKETTTPYDIERGIVNIVVGFAPLKPAEFVIIQIQQITRSSE
jgi:phage tail sheath protein FI